MQEQTQDIGKNSSVKPVKVYDRRLKASVPGIATIEDKFILESGHYVNEAETVILKSTNETGKFFKKVV